MAVSHVKSNPIADFTGTVTAFNSQGSTITVNATDIVRPSDWNSAHNFYQTISGNTAGQSTVSGTNLVFQGGNNVTLSLSTAAGAATMVVSGPSQTTQPVAISGSNGSFAFSTATFGNLNGLSFYTSNGSMVGSYTVPAAQTNQSLGLYASSNTTGQSSSTTVDARSLSFRGAGVASVGYSGGEVIISVPAGGGAGDGYNILAAGTQTATTAGSVLFENSNGITFGMSGSTRITASHNGLTSQSNQALSGSNGSLTFQTASFGNLNGVSFYTSNGSFVASHNGLTTARASTDAIGLNTAQSNVTWTVNSSGLSLDARGYAGTATAVTGGAAMTVNSGGVSFNGASLAGTSTGFTGANVSASMTHNTAGLALSLSVAAPGGGGGGIAAAAGTQTATSGTVVFANSNGLTFGMSGSSQITGSYTVPTQTAQSIGVYGTSNTTGQSSSSTYDARSLTIRGYGVLSVGNSNGSILLSTPDPVVFTQLSVGNSTGGNTAGDTGAVTGRLILAGGANITLSGSTNAGSMTISVIGGAGGGGGAAISAGANSQNTGTVNFANSNGITFGLSNNGTMTASHNGLTTAALSNHSHGNPTLNLTNLSGTTASNSAGFTLSLSAGGGGGVNPVASASNGSFSFTTLAFSNANNVTFGTSAGSIITASVAAPGAAAEANAIELLGANTAGNTTATGSTIGWSGQNITLSGLNNSQVVISAPATSSLVGVGGISISTNGSTISVSNVGVTRNYFNPQDGYVQVAGQQGQASMHIQPVYAPNVSFDRLAMPLLVTNATNSTGTVTVSYGFGIYTRNASTLSLLSSTSASQAVTFSGTVNNSTFAGMRLLTIGTTGELTEGQYYVGIWSRTTTGGANCSVSQYLASQVNSVFSGILGAASNASIQYTRGLGVYSATFSTALPASVAISQLQGSGSVVLRQPVFYLANQTF